MRVVHGLGVTWRLFTVGENGKQNSGMVNFYPKSSGHLRTSVSKNGRESLKLVSKMVLKIWNIITEYSIRLWVWYIPYRTMKDQLYRSSVASGNHSTGTTLTEMCSFYFRTAHFTTLSYMVNNLCVPVSNAFCLNLSLKHPLASLTCTHWV